MTRLISVDPGKNSGVAVGYYDAITPYRLLERYQVHNGVEGFTRWLEQGHMAEADEIVVERFVLADNDFVADTTPLRLEGLILGAQRFGDGIVADVPIVWQTRQDKWSLCGYPPEADTKEKRQRVRFQFLDRFGLFAPGEDNTDSNDAATHSVVFLKRRLHYPTISAMYPPTPRKLV